MAYQIQIATSAEFDFSACYRFIHDRSPAGARGWRKAFDQAVESLRRDPHRGIAPESESHAEEIRQRIFKTSKGRPYRLLFLIRGEVVHVIHVRGASQEVMDPSEVNIPDN